MRLKSLKLLSFFWEYNRWLVLFSVLTGIIAGGSSAALVTLINGRITGGMSVSQGSVRAYAIFAALALLATTLSGFLSSQLAQRTSAHLRLYLCRRILAVPLRTLEEAGTHRILTALTQDIMSLIGAFLRVPPFFINLAIVTGGLVYLGWLSPVMLLILVAFVVLSIVSYVLPQRSANRYMTRAREEYSTMVDHFRALTSGAKELKLHRARRAAFLSEVVEPTVHTLRKHSVAGEGIYVLLNSWSQILYFIVIGLILFALPDLVGNVGLQILTGYALTVLYISGPIQSLVNIVPNFSQATISLRRLEELGLSLTHSDTPDETAAPAPPEQRWERLELDGVTHTYYREAEASSFVLGPIDLTFKPGELVFLVGGNGSGKTTLAKLLCGLYVPEHGEIRLDGVPVTNDNIDDYRQYFSVVFTEFHVFAQLLGLDHPELDKVAREYLTRLQLNHKVEVKDGKLSTTALSYGQRKRLALLTAFLEDRPLYVFDEWAADQDPLFRDIFYNHILAELKARGKTVIVISHDDHYYHLGDRIVRLEYGQIEYDKPVAEWAEKSSEVVLEGAGAGVLGEITTTPSQLLKGRLAPSDTGGTVTGPTLQPADTNGNGKSTFQLSQAARNLPPQQDAPPRAEEFEPVIPRSRLATFLLAILFVAACVWLSVQSLRPPDVVGANAPAAEFSSERAMRHLRAVAARPRPSGAAAHADVRQYILDALRAEGLNPEVQQAVVAQRRGGEQTVVSVQNLFAVLKGTEPQGKALMLAAHYDSAPNSPGASDDGAGVAALLETLRALKAGPPPRRDVLFLFTDAEELGLLGAKAFVEESAWAGRVGLALNFEARGSRGPVYMFETSEGNGRLVREFASAAPAPFASSLMYSVYKLLPNDTDLTVFKSAGIPGLNFAYIGGAQHYHTAQDTPSNMDERSLQHHGSYALALTRHFAALDLENVRQGDAVYFDLLGATLITYPQTWVLPLCLLVVALFVALMFFGLRRGALTARGSAFGALVLLACAACSAGAVKLIWWALTTMHGGFTPRTHADIFVVGFTLLTLGITVALYASLGRRTTLNNLAAGALACWTIVMLAASLLLPGASYLFTWPLLSSLLALGFVLYTAEKTGTRPARFLVLAACAVPGLLLLTNVIAGLYQGVGLSMPVALVALEVLLLGLLVPFLRYITSRFRWLFVTASLLVGAACVFLGIVTPLYDERNPRPNSLLYSLNADTGQTTWMSTDARPDAWTSQFFKASHNDPNQPPAASGRALTAPAPAVELPLEELSVLGDEVVSGVRRLRVRVTSPRRARRINMYVDPSVKITAAVVNGKRLEYAGASEADRADEGWELAYVAAPAEGFELTLETPSAAPLKLKVAGYADGLPHVPSMQITPRPPNLMPGPNSDQTRVVKTFDLGPAPR